MFLSILFTLLSLPSVDALILVFPTAAKITLHHTLKKLVRVYMTTQNHRQKGYEKYSN